jgi:ABC-type antimicrobial peptide transport system permease subunit
LVAPSAQAAPETSTVVRPRRAIGARRRDIRFQFVVEAFALSAFRASHLDPIEALRYE